MSGEGSRDKPYPRFSLGWQVAAPGYGWRGKTSSHLPPEAGYLIRET